MGASGSRLESDSHVYLDMQNMLNRIPMARTTRSLRCFREIQPVICSRNSTT